MNTEIVIGTMVFLSLWLAGADPGIKLTAAQHRKHLRQGRGSKLASCHA